MSDLYKILTWKCQQILEWSSTESGQWFNDNFIADIYHKIEDGKELSSKQISSIENIYSKFCQEKDF